MPVENRAAFIDPEGTFLPFKPPYIFTRNGVRQGIFSTPGAALFAPWSSSGVNALAWPSFLGAGLLLFAIAGARGPSLVREWRIIAGSVLALIPAMARSTLSWSDGPSWRTCGTLSRRSATTRAWTRSCPRCNR